MEFYIDSGASDHMIKEKRFIRGIQSLKLPIKVSVAEEGRNMQADCKGSLNLSCIVYDNSVNGNVDGALCT